MAKKSEAAARHYDVVLAPHITEKATLLSEHNGVVFKVANDATKPQIKQAIEALFGVKVRAVNTVLTKGKVVIADIVAGDHAILLERSRRLGEISRARALIGCGAMQIDLAGLAMVVVLAAAAALGLTALGSVFFLHRNEPQTTAMLPDNTGPLDALVESPEQLLEAFVVSNFDTHIRSSPPLCVR